MSTVRVNHLQRPVRIAFLLRPNDQKSLRKIIGVNSSIWGGMWNPIVPVFDKVPKNFWIGEWATNYKTAKGFIKYFEPDLIVEAKNGLHEKVGLDGFEELYGQDKIILLDDFFRINDRGFLYPRFGIDIETLATHQYRSEFRFVHRHKTKTIINKSRKIFFDAMVGSYEYCKYKARFTDIYEQVYEPKPIKLVDLNVILSVIKRERKTQLDVTNFGLEFFPADGFRHGAKIYICNMDSALDAISFWSLRAINVHVIPLPIELLEELSEDLVGIISNYFERTKKCVEIQWSKSVETSELLGRLGSFLGSRLPKNSYTMVRNTSNLLNFDYSNDTNNIYPARANVYHSKKTHSLEVSEQYTRITLPSSKPKFEINQVASFYRWTDTWTISTYDERLAPSFPFLSDGDRLIRNLFLGENISYSSEGFTHLNSNDIGEHLELPTNEKLISQQLKLAGLKNEVSDAGKVAREIIKSLKSLMSTSLLAHSEVVTFMDKARDSSYGIPAGDIYKVASQIKIKPDRFLNWLINVGAIQVGIISKCTVCSYKNWYELSLIDYHNKCQRCLERFPFSQYIQFNRIWRYKVIGPFSTEDYARGSYSVVLTLRALSKIHPHASMTYSVGREITDKNDIAAELDFISYCTTPTIISEKVSRPSVIIGECKSFAQDAVKPEDVAQIKKAVVMLSASLKGFQEKENYIVISVLKEKLSRSEIVLLKELNSWIKVNRQSMFGGVIVLTGNELFSEISISYSWEKIGGVHRDMASQLKMFGSLKKLSQTTQKIYLDN